jgi:uncharacterized RDD family membrane protein YckC
MNRAGFGARVFNFVIDTLLVFGLAYVLHTVWVFYVRNWGLSFIPFYAFFWMTLVLYYFLFESISLRTPAKWMSISKVVTKTGQRPALWQILVRSLVRVTLIDAFFIPFLDVTLHDYLSGTEVVEA